MWAARRARSRRLCRRRSREGHPDIPVRPGTQPGARAGSAFARGCVQVRVELGTGQSPGTVRGRGQVVLRHRPAQDVERGEKADPALVWWSENSKCVYQEAFNDLHRALRDFDKSRKGLRKGKRLGFPKVKKRGKCRDSFRFGGGVIRCAEATVTLPRLGTIRTHESTRKLARRLAGGTARILSATVSRTAQRWFVSFTVEVERAIPERHARPGSERCAELARPPPRDGQRSRYRQWGGNRLRRQGLRLRRSCKTRPGRAAVANPRQWEEAGTRHRACGSDRDRRRATGGCESYAYQGSLTRNGDWL
jgi:hypothetical protein